MAEVFVGIDVGGTNVKVGCFDNKLKLIGKTSIATEAEMGAKVLIERIVGAVEDCLRKSALGLGAVRAAGLGTPGPADYQKGIIFQAANMPKFRNVAIKAMLSRALGKPVVFDNDANAACFGEFEVGAGRGVRDMVFFTLGTGIGGGIVSGGKLIGGSGGNAAELGHIIICPDGRRCNCGQCGCVEAYASANSTAKRAMEALAAGERSSLEKVLKVRGEVTCKDVFEHSAKGDKLARKITDGTAEALALVCLNMVHVTDPERIVFAGGMIAAGEVLLERIRFYFNEYIWKLKEEKVEICFATLGEDAGIIGAAALARAQAGS